MSTHQGKELEDFINQRRAKERGGLNVAKVASLVGVSRTAIYNWYEQETLSLDIIAMLKRTIGFMSDTNKAAFTSVNFDIKQVAEPGLQMERHNIIRVPLHAVGGFLQGYRNKVYMDMLQRYSMPGFDGEYWDFEVEGMSMYKMDDERSAKPGDRLLCKRMESFMDLRKGKGYVLQTVDGLCYKIFDKIKDERATFHSLSDGYKNMEFSLKEIKVIYYVDFIMRKQNS